MTDTVNILGRVSTGSFLVVQPVTQSLHGDSYNSAKQIIKELKRSSGLLFISESQEKENKNSY